MSQDLLRELARVKVMFQQRAIAAALQIRLVEVTPVTRTLAPRPLGLPLCSCPPEVIARVQAGGTCAGGGCPYGGDF